MPKCKMSIIRTAILRHMNRYLNELLLYRVFAFNLKYLCIA